MPALPSRPDTESRTTMTPPPNVRAADHKHVQIAPAAAEAATRSPTAETDAPASPLRTVQVQLGDAPGEGVNVRFVESGGVVKVTVRTQDESLAHALNAEAPALESRLQSQGWSGEFHSVEAVAAELRTPDGPSVSGTAPARQQEAAGAPVVRQAQAGPGAGSGDANRRPSASWAEQNEELLNTAALRRLAQKGVSS